MLTKKKPANIDGGFRIADADSFSVGESGDVALVNGDQLAAEVSYSSGTTAI